MPDPQFPFRDKQYDYIIAGAGCAGLSLLMRMIETGYARGKRILLIDKDEKKKNDRTWCFWETGTGFFEPIVRHQWAELDFFSATYSKTFNIAPYHYKMIRGIDFYHYCFDKIEKQENIDIVYGNIQAISADNNGVSIEMDSRSFQFARATVFNSIPYSPPAPDKAIRLLQHFKGWTIETNLPVFDISKATLMDFRVHQEHGTAFVYVLPLSSTTALVEYTMFTAELLEPAQYDQELRTYIQDWLQPGEYKVTDEEFGVIPMTNQVFPFSRKGIYYIGTAGGQTKGSSGYTFQFIQKQSGQIVQQLMAGKNLQQMASTPTRFHFYDNTLLHILYHKQLPGSRIFSDLFKKNKPQHVLRFLDNETSLKEELKIISSLPTWPFLKAALQQGY